MFRMAICEKETEKRNYLMAAVSTIAEDISAREFRNLDDLKAVSYTHLRAHET